MPILFVVFVSDLPNPGELSSDFIPKTTKIYDRNGNLLYEIFASQNRTVVPLGEIPDAVKFATIAIEDKDFYNHPGFDLRGITRAFISNIQNRELQGGSTITQQLIKSAFLTPEPSLTRKAKEVAIAFWAERMYSKDQILEMYFNYVPYGGTAWGIESASRIYFNKHVSDLTLAESAYLAGLPRAPSLYSPYGTNPDLGKRRQKDVLSAMVRDGYITQQAADEAFKEELAFEPLKSPIKAPHFVMYVRELLTQKYGLSEVERGGLQVTTTLDLELQEEAEDIVAEEVENNAHLNVGNGAALITDPKNGDVLAMVGSKNYFDRQGDGNVNLTTALRQPGSTIKLVTYTLALSSGFTEATLIDDSPLSIKTASGEVYSPVNYSGVYHGRQTLRVSFANSYNIPAVKVAQRLGVDQLVNFGKAMGITSWHDSSRYGLSLTLGAGETTMTEMATVFGTVANEGKRIDLNPILEIKDAFGKTIYTKRPIPTQVVDPGVSFIISDILADNEARSREFGSNSPLHIPGHRVSVKTGTTDNKRDNWTIGYTNNFVVATWVGNNNNEPMSQNLASGITGAAPMWSKLTTLMLEDYPSVENVLPPINVVRKYCQGGDRYFIRGTENSVECGRRPLQNPSISPSPRIN